MRRYTNESLLQHIWQGVTALWSNESRETGPIYSMDEEKINVCAQIQDKVGWDNLFYGRVATEWGVLNRKLLKGKKHRLDATTWTVYLIRELYKIGLGLWRARNEGEHGTKTGVSLEDRDAANDTIRMLYEYIKPVVLPQDSWLFQKSEKIKIRERFDDQTAWIDAVARVYKKELADHKISIPGFKVGQQRYSKLTFL